MRKLTFRQAFIRILISTLLISGTAAMILLYYFNIQEIRLNDKRYNITYLRQSGEGKGKLSTQYLAELLELSADVNNNLYGFNIDLAAAKLLSSPIIKSAKLRKESPNTLSVDYSLRTPKYLLQNFSNTAVDEEGMLLPVFPFFNQSNIPQICIENTEHSLYWGQKISSELFSLIIDMTKAWEQLSLGSTLELRRIDLSRLNAPSLGERQVVLVVAHKTTGELMLLRLRHNNYHEQLREFALLVNEMKKRKENIASKVIDLRLPKLAFLSDLGK